jgi:hypothetical protein
MANWNIASRKDSGNSASMGNGQEGCFPDSGLRTEVAKRKVRFAPQMEHKPSAEAFTSIARIRGPRGSNLSREGKSSSWQMLLLSSSPWASCTNLGPRHLCRCCERSAHPVSTIVSRSCRTRAEWRCHHGVTTPCIPEVTRGRRGDKNSQPPAIFYQLVIIFRT